MFQDDGRDSHLDDGIKAKTKTLCNYFQVLTGTISRVRPFSICLLCVLCVHLGRRYLGQELGAHLHWGVVMDLSAVRTQPTASLLSL